MLYLLDVFFTLEELVPDLESFDFHNNTIDYDYNYYDYLTNSERTDTFTIQCSDYYLVGSQSWNSSFEVSYWNDSSNYWDAWVDQYNQTIANMLQEAAYDYYEWPDENYDYHVRIACDEDYGHDDGWNNVHLIDIPIPNGMAIDLVRIEVYGWCHEEGRWTLDGTGYCRSDWDNDGSLQYWDYEHFNVDLVWEDFSDVNTGSPLWIGGDGDSVLSVYLDDLYPNQQYRLRIYFETITVLNVEE